MKSSLHKLFVFLIAICLLVSPSKTFAFALLGPVQPWMQATNGVIRADDIGGPMDIGSGYRWNVPVLTYGFDQSFLDYFGTNGVAAVEGAMEILNSLPPVSQLDLTSYPLESYQQNNIAASQSLLDLKSKTLQLLLEHMGLASPTRNFFVIREWTNALCPPPAQYSAEFGPVNWGNWAIPDFIYLRNFDPQTFQGSHYLNSNLYYGYILHSTVRAQNLTFLTSVGWSGGLASAVADLDALDVGNHVVGLTMDDVGGLVFLYSTNRVNYEQLLPDVISSGTNGGAFVNGARRPGVDKINFIPHPVDSNSGIFLPATNVFTDRYVTNGVLHSQQLARIISQPDFLFSVGDVKPAAPSFPIYFRTGTTNWLNNAIANGNTNLAGPGVIQPPVQIVFNKLGPSFANYGSQPPQEFSTFWGSFDSSTNPPVFYSAQQANVAEITVRLWLILKPESFQSFDWKLDSQPGGIVTVQTSTNLSNWTTLFTANNIVGNCTFISTPPAGNQRFYRLVQQ